MEQRFKNFNSLEEIENPSGYLKQFVEQTNAEAFKKFEANGDLDALEYYLETEIIDFYYQKSLGIVNPDNFQLKYINKN